MPFDAERAVSGLLALDVMEALPRTGWLQRGVAAPESLAAHSFGVALVAMALVDAARDAGMDVDGERVLRMALLHDAGEAATGDVPAPRKSPALKAALVDAERSFLVDILGEETGALHDELEARATLEAGIVKAADGLQLIAKTLMYERQRRGDLRDFWEAAAAFESDVPGAMEMKRALFARR